MITNPEAGAMVQGQTAASSAGDDGSQPPGEVMRRSTVQYTCIGEPGEGGTAVRYQ